jgi:hypothetical protein
MCFLSIPVGKPLALVDNILFRLIFNVCFLSIPQEKTVALVGIFFQLVSMCVSIASAREDIGASGQHLLRPIDQVFSNHPAREGSGASGQHLLLLNYQCIFSASRKGLQQIDQCVCSTSRKEDSGASGQHL